MDHLLWGSGGAPRHFLRMSRLLPASVWHCAVARHAVAPAMAGRRVSKLDLQIQTGASGTEAFLFVQHSRSSLAKNAPGHHKQTCGIAIRSYFTSAA